MSVSESCLAQAEEALRNRKLVHAAILFEEAELQGACADRCAGGRWMIHMLCGAFEQAWKESDALREREVFDPHRMWQGETIAGKRLMVRCLHGFGDAVQFLRYIPRLREVAAKVIVQVAPRFIELAPYFSGVEDAITWGESSPSREPDWDVQIEIMELPYLFRTQITDLPIAVPYLQLPRQSGTQNPGCRECLQVGLMWTAGEWNAARSIPFSTVRPLLDVEGYEFWNLQLCRSPFDDAAMLEDDNCRRSIAGLAARIASLDLVITVDTLAAHLAGALNVPAWVMLQQEADWRWMHRREDSPWYPSLRLFRQIEAGDWASVIESVTAALRERLRSHPGQRMVA